jgi:hypothetical protein
MRKLEPNGQPDAHPANQPDMLALNLADILGCTLACIPVEMHPRMQPGEHHNIKALFKEIRCEYGFSPQQINTLSILKAKKGRVISYAQLAKELGIRFGLEVSRDMARGYVERIRKRGFLSHRQARDGCLHGVRVRISKEEICEYIYPAYPGVQPEKHPAGHLGVQHGVQPGNPLPPSKNLDKKEEKNLICMQGSNCNMPNLSMLTEEDIALHWPCLAQNGFGQSQLRQIQEQLEKIGKSHNRVIEGLTYAEWELVNGKMCGAKGKPVLKPVNYVFSSLSRNGCYRRPEGYVSPMEKLEQEALEEAKRIRELREKRFEIDYKPWRQALSQAELQNLLGDNRINLGETAREAIIRNHFRKHVWQGQWERKAGNPQSAETEGQPTRRGHAHFSGAGQGQGPLEPQKAEEGDGHESR